MVQILLAHGSPFLRRLLVALLEEEHTVVAEVTNGVEAVEVYPDVQPDVALLARSMPITDGLEACAELNDIDRDASVVLCAGEGGAASDGAREAGVDECVISPFQQSGVLASVDRAAD